MRDIKLIYPPDGSYILDISIRNGKFQFVTSQGQTQDQRASVSALMIRGTVPGRPNLGISWGSIYTNDENTLIVVDNEVKQAIQKNASIPGDITGSYIPDYQLTEKGISLKIYRSQS